MTPGLQGGSTAASATSTRTAATLLLFEPPARGTTAKPGGKVGEVAFQFNPKELVMAKEANWERRDAQGSANASPPQYKGPKPSKLTLEMFLDDAEKRTGSVVKTVEKLFACCVPTAQSAAAGKNNPMWVQFQWGGITSFYAYLSSVQAKYTLFTGAGLPIRAVVTVTLEEIATAPPRQNPTSGTLVPHREHVVVEGDSLQAIAYAEYGDPARWRDVARVNGIDDPTRVPTGRRLLLPLAAHLADRPGDSAAAGAGPGWAGAGTAAADSSAAGRG
ncbi:LysM peptidoglycan-binding domain-containing protein [Miniimonas arenae]|uniref:CIS tube protein n=1 Tax=Miniimonas arenae TaxID=676201 RepID=UPI0015D633E8|nr:LysM peptidoglycan-binding domain-containing protein [Miniimonas arenae]